MDAATGHIIVSSLILSGLSVVAITFVALLALCRPRLFSHITAEAGASVNVDQANGDITKPARLPDTTIAALEDALAYLALAADAQDAEKQEAARQSLGLAAFILRQQREGEYSPNLSVAELVTQYRQMRHHNTNSDNVSI